MHKPSLHLSFQYTGWCGQLAAVAGLFGPLFIWHVARLVEHLWLTAHKVGGQKYILEVAVQLFALRSLKRQFCLHAAVNITYNTFSVDDYATHLH